MNTKITPKQFVSTCVLFMISSIQVINIYPNSKINIWFAAIVGAVASIPILLMFARLSGLYPEEDLFGIIEKTVGNIAGKGLSIIYTIYGLYLGIVTIRYLTEFIQVVSMNETPQIILLIIFGFLCGYIVYKGSGIITKLSTVILPVVFAIFIFIIICSFGFYDYSYLKPGLDENISTFSDAAFSVASFSFCEIIFIISFLKNTELNQKKKYSLLMISLLIGTVFTVAQLLSNQLILGTSTSSILYFPNYEAVSIINIEDFITHIEVISIISFLMCVIIKESVCIFTVSKGINKIFNLRNPKLTEGFATLAVIIGGAFVFDSTMDMYKFHELNKYIVLIFQAAVPFLIYSIAEIKNIRSKTRNTINEQSSAIKNQRELI